MSDAGAARGRVVLLVTSPRLPAGLLTAAAWDTVRALPVFAASTSGQTAALAAAGVPVTITHQPVRDLLAAREAVWLAGPTGDEEVARELGLRLAREPGLAELELMYGSWDPPGARLLDAVEVMDRLRGPGGDPWKQRQTHRSLANFLLEEAYEAYDAIQAEDHAALREELGDVLLQVVLHARLAEELPDGTAYTVDDVAGDLVAKMVRRNPHVFPGGAASAPDGGAAGSGAAGSADNRSAGAGPGDAGPAGTGAEMELDEIVDQWERIKKAEKARASVLDGIARSQPALALATKILSRARRAGITPPLPSGDDPGARLLRLVADEVAADGDPEGALRTAALAYADEIRVAESG